jgi:hypothetical protein
MEDLIMKKLIMFVMVLAIATPAVALVYPPHSPGFAGCENSGQVIWEFLEDGCEPSSDQADPAYYFDPDLVDPVFGTRYVEGGPDWDWADGVYTVNTEDSLNQPIPDSGGKSYMRMYFEVTHTIVENDDESFIGMGLELWELEDWTGCPAASGNDGEIGAIIGGYEFPPPTEQYDVGGGWYQSIWVADFSEDGSVASWEDYYGVSYEFGDPTEWTHTTAIIGMSDFGASGFQLEEVYINYIWFDETDGSDIPTEDCVPIIGEAISPITVDVNDIPIYEPQDTGGPEPLGPVEGQLLVSLTYRPGENLGDPPFTATILVDPDPNQENVGSADFEFIDSTEPNDNITLTFTEANWNVPQAVRVKAVKDLLQEGNESFKIGFTGTIDIADPNFGGPGYDPIYRTRGIIVVDNDIPFIWTLPTSIKGQLSENDPCVSKCFNVKLSHVPTANVEITVVRESDYAILLDSMSVMVPPLGEADDPNKLYFTPANYAVTQQICLEARDDDIRDEGPEEAGLEWVPGVVILTPHSKGDPRYDIELESEFAISEAEVSFDVQDNECGAWGYDAVDMNQDCVVNLTEVAVLYNQWLFCTKPYAASPDGGSDWGDCDAAWNLVEE